MSQDISLNRLHSSKLLSSSWRWFRSARLCRKSVLLEKKPWAASFSTDEENFGSQKASSGPKETESQENKQSSTTAETPKNGADTKEKISKLKLRLLQYCASTDRGQNTTQKQKSAIEEIAMALEALNPTPNPVEASNIDGLWFLNYLSEKFYTTNALLAAAAATPLISVGQIKQEISIANGSLSNEIDLILFPNITCTLVTKGRITPLDGERLQVSAEKTTIKGGSIGEQFDLGSFQLNIPVEELVRRLRGATPETFLDTYYLDEDLRISRSKGGRLFIFSRFPELDR
eukprot:jgi/Galph1/805/GphlegSOOS_G5562.1